jgi:hypothetical protein
LNRISHEKNRSRAAIVREAVGEYLAGRRKKSGGKAFGIWKDKAIDGLKYQQKLRREWSARS